MSWPFELDEDISDSVEFAGLVKYLDYGEGVVAGAFAAAAVVADAVTADGAAVFLEQLLVQTLHTQNHKFHLLLYPRDNLTAIKRIK